MAGSKFIGYVVNMLKADYPDLKISKIRFLESEGLLCPERTDSGYRKYSEADIARLRYILEAQEKHWVPLKEIKKHLDMMDQGLEPPPLGVAETVIPPAPAPTPMVSAPRGSQPIRITREELLKVSGLSETDLLQLEEYQLVFPRKGTNFYGRDALTIAVVARKLQDFGMDARHLRLLKQAGEREVNLIEQAVAPVAARGGNTTQLAADLLKLFVNAQAAMMRQLMVRG